jgi:hypothetical protein
MRKRISLLIAALMMALTMGFAGIAQAAPIECKGNSEPVKVNGEFVCQNSGGGTPGGAVEPKNKNA